MALEVHVKGWPKAAARLQVFLSVEPKTIQEFEVIVKALGGAAAFQPASVSTAAAYAIHVTATGQRLLLYPPTDYEAPKPKGHPFIQRFNERIEAAKEGKS